MVVPAATVARVVGAIQAHGRVPRGYLGVGVYPVRLNDAQAKSAGQQAGLLLVAVESGSPAEKAGLVLGDVLLTIDGAAVERPGELSGLLADKVGAAVRAKVLRAGSATEVSVTVGQRAE
jgi:S1-C subfamily serine protease